MEEKTKLSSFLESFKSNFKEVNTASLIGKLQGYERPRLSLLSPREAYRDVGPDPRILLEPPTSDEDSEDAPRFPSVRKVTETILDSHNTNITVEAEAHSFHLPALIFFNLDSHMTHHMLLSVLTKLSPGLVRVHSVDFFSVGNFIHCAIAYFRCYEEAKATYDRLRGYEEKGLLNSVIYRIPGAQQNISVRWFINRVLEPNLEWTGLILRGLRRNITIESLRHRFGELAARIEPPRMVSGELCTLAVMKSHEAAEKVLKNYSRLKLDGRCDLHPYSFIFKRPDRVYHSIYSSLTNGRKPEIDPEKSIKLLEKVVKAFEAQKPSPKQTQIEQVENLEDGEISDVEGQASHSFRQFTYHTLFEYPGRYLAWEGHRQNHSGVYIKTIHAAPEYPNEHH